METIVASKPQQHPAQADFRKFLFLVWTHLSLPAPTRVQYDIARYLQHGPKRSIISAFRGVGKSWITAAYVVWLLWCDPQVRILVVSASKERSDGFSIFVKRIINELPFLAHLQAGPGQRDSNVAFEVGPARADQAPSVKSLGITSQLTGSRADYIIADDVEIPANSYTQMQRDKLREQVKEFDDILKPKKGSRIVFLGTPQTEMSLYNALAEGSYDMRIWPAQYPNPVKVGDYHGRLAPLIADELEERPELAGSATDPERFTLEDLQERRAGHGAARYSLQFMLDTALSDADRYPLRLRDLVVMDLDKRVAPLNVVWCSAPDKVLNELPNFGFSGDRYHRPMWYDTDMAPYTGGIMGIDPSGNGPDETAYSVIKMLNGLLYASAFGGFKDGYGRETLLSLANIAKTNGVTKIVVENNFGMGMFARLLQPVLIEIGYPCTIEDRRSYARKEERIIDVLEPVMASHKLIVDKTAIEHDWETCGNEKERSLFYQMVRITNEKGALKFDDRLDVLALTVNEWMEQMILDADKEAEGEHSRRLEQAMKEFERYASDPFGKPAFSNSIFQR